MLHAAHRALARGRHHVVAVGGRAVAGDLGIDLGAARLGVLEFFQHQHAGAAGDDEAVAVLVVGARGRLPACRCTSTTSRPWRRTGSTASSRSSSQPPANTMSCLPHWISLGAVADAVVGGRAGRRDRIVDALDLEPGGERRRGGRRHRLRHRERADALGRALFARDVGGLDDGARSRDRPSP